RDRHDYGQCLQVGVPALLLFFFQAEDGIRDATVTGVQTCALPISSKLCPWVGGMLPAISSSGSDCRSSPMAQRKSRRRNLTANEIGRASCRERVETSGG